MCNVHVKMLLLLRLPLFLKWQKPISSHSDSPSYWSRPRASCALTCTLITWGPYWNTDAGSEGLGWSLGFQFSNMSHVMPLLLVHETHFEQRGSLRVTGDTWRGEQRITVMTEGEVMPSSCEPLHKVASCVSPHGVGIFWETYDVCPFKRPPLALPDFAS